jgi:hypothetical protein
MGNKSVLVKQRVQTNIRIVITLVAAIALLTGHSLFAAPAPVVNNANTLKISPVRSDTTIAPGTSGKVTMTLTNLTNAPMTIQATENDFVAGDERGTPALILDADKFAPTHSLKRFMVPMPNVTVPPNSNKDVEVTINVPKDAKSGGYYGAVRFIPVTPDGNTSVNLNASVASLVLLTVPGPVSEQLNLTDFSIKQGNKVDTFFQSSNDLQLTYRFENKGSIQEGPFGKIVVKQGKDIIYSYDFNQADPREMVLPDSARRWDVPLKNIGSFGNYTVTATFSYGKSNQTIDVTKSFWVVPWYVIIATGVGILVLIIIIVGIWLFLRSYKRRILRSGTGRRNGYRRR